MKNDAVREDLRRRLALIHARMEGVTEEDIEQALQTGRGKRLPVLGTSLREVSLRNIAERTAKRQQDSASTRTGSSPE